MDTSLISRLRVDLVLPTFSPPVAFHFTFNFYFFPSESVNTLLTLANVQSNCSLPVEHKNHKRQTSNPFHFTSSSQYLHDTVLLGHSSSKCFLRSFLWNFLPHSFGQSDSTNWQTFKCSLREKNTCVFVMLWLQSQSYYTL